MTVTTYTIQDSLAFDPFAGDFGGSGESDAILKDKIVQGRKAHTCSHCGEEIAPKAEHRVRVEIFDGEFMSFRWCAACCHAMNLFSFENDFQTFENRRKK